jgi:hypothetical protein
MLKKIIIFCRVEGAKSTSMLEPPRAWISFLEVFRREKYLFLKPLTCMRKKPARQL